ncbi:MAG: cell division protein FtsZ [Verrucomicrobiota bacterium]|nr:cell division protein FtsZ [Verrucomicrobiota bacterium]MDK2964349.1 cell division protein FtsZ [Verrucomicrobiota bacterium]
MIDSSKKILILGLGGAGCNTIAGIVPYAVEGMEFAVADCDFQTLETCAHIEHRLAIGKAFTDGMGAGGDIEIGRRCAENASSQLEILLSGVDLLMVITGLGGGFGTGASPVVARMARGFGAATLFFTVLPFPFEGPAVQNRARTAIRRLRTYADAIVQMPNALIQPDGEALFKDSLERSNQTLAAGVSSLWKLLARPGICNLDFVSLHTMLSYCDAFCRFSCAAAAGQGRVDHLIDALRTHPLVADGAVFENASGMIVGITGGEDMKLSEIQQIVEGVAPEGEECWLKTGVVIDPSSAGSISAIILAAESWKEPLVDDGRGGLRPASGIGKQGELAGILKPRSRTFGGAERTIWKGEDLDIPTYIRWKIKLPK